jgi:enoyl-CoA hydratase/carnithine racemase
MLLTRVSRYQERSWLAYGHGGQSALLAHNVGPSNAALMLLTGDPVDAATALRWGLVTEVVAPDELLAVALRLAAA